MECDYCHKDKENVEYTTDPFAEQILNDYTKNWWCQDCLNERADQI